MTDQPGTTNFPFTGKDVEELTDTLSKMAVLVHLPEAQWGLLLSIFAAASGHVEGGGNEMEGKFAEVGVKDGRPIKDPRNKEYEALREQLLNAYIPGGSPDDRPLRDMVQPPRHT